MEARRFDTFARAFGSEASRRKFLGGVAGGVSGWLAPFAAITAIAHQGGCDSGLVDCGGVCLDLSSDPFNCGECGVACGTGSCTGGVCSVAVDVGVGTCENTCPEPYVQDPASCQCLCPAGLTDCDGACIDATSDPANCGICGATCLSGGSCLAGTCVCPDSTTPCATECVPVCGEPFVLDFATCECACFPGVACSPGQTLDRNTCNCVDTSPSSSPAATETTAPEPTATEESTPTATAQSGSSPAAQIPATPTMDELTGDDATSVSPDVTPAATPPTSSEIVIRICWETKSGGKLCVEFEIKGRGNKATAKSVVVSDTKPPTRLEVTQGADPAGFATSVIFSDIQSSTPILEVDGLIEPDGSSSFRLRFVQGGLDYLAATDGPSGSVSIESGGRLVTGVFNPTSGVVENLSGELPSIPLPAAVMERVTELLPAFGTIVVATEAGHRMQVPEDDFCLPRPFGAALPAESLAGGIAAVMAAGCCLGDAANCATCQTAASALTSTFAAANANAG